MTARPGGPAGGDQARLVAALRLLPGFLLCTGGLAAGIVNGQVGWAAALAVTVLAPA
jgi:hypothetical protein